MPFIIIKKLPVFLTAKRQKELKEQALKDKTSEFRVRSITGNTKEQKIASKLMYQYLINESKNNPKDFYLRWVYFDMTDEEASKTAWDLLYDYCVYRGNAYLSRYSNNAQQIILENLLGLSYQYPMGKVFWFNHISRPKYFWWRLTRRSKNRNIRVLIDCSKVQQITGTLDSFTIDFDNAYLRCEEKEVVLISGWGA